MNEPWLTARELAAEQRVAELEEKLRKINVAATRAAALLDSGDSE